MSMLIVALVALLLFPEPSVLDRCPDALVVGVAGSGQSGFGEQVEGVVSRIEEQAASAGLHIASEPLDYPAISVSDSFGLVLFTGEYDESVDAGSDALVTVLDRLAAECPSVESVIVGYSQGAEVIKQAFEDPEARYRVSSVVLLADPTRDPDQAGVLRLGDPSGDRGGAFGRSAIPDAISPIAIDVCASGDGVCERGRFGIGAHVLGYDDVPVEVAPIVVGRLVASASPLVRPR